jgi:hypothetical protein
MHLRKVHHLSHDEWKSMGGEHWNREQQSYVVKAEAVKAEPDPLETTDGMEWAKAFQARFGGRYIPLPGERHATGIPYDQGLLDDLHAWFANAIERGRIAGQPRYGSFPQMVETELAKAREAHGPVNSLHEGYAIIKEELGEFWRQVQRWHSQGHKGRDTSDRKALKELVQTAAMCQRTAEDRGLIPE